MSRFYAQGDILLERVNVAPVSGQILHAPDAEALVVAEGELSGHHHKISGCATLYRDDALARDIPDNLYIGHLQVVGTGVRLEHEEHAPITLQQGTYRVRRQRQLGRSDIGIAGD